MEKLEMKLKQLNLCVLQTKNILDSGKRESIKRHLDALPKIVQKFNKFKLAAEAAKIELADVEMNMLESWLWLEKEQLSVELKLHEKRMKMKAELELNKTAPEV